MASSGVWIVKRRVSYHTGLNPTERTNQSVLFNVGIHASQTQVLILCGSKPDHTVTLNIIHPVHTWIHSVPPIYFYRCKGISSTIVLNVSGLLLGLVHRDSMDLHPDQRIHYRILFDVDFGKLLATDHLETNNVLNESFIFFIFTYCSNHYSWS